MIASVIPTDALRVLIWLIALLPWASWWYWLQRRRRGRLILQFGSGDRVDVVLTTSARSEVPAEGVQAKRPLTGYGQVHAAVSCTSAVTRLYPRKRLALHHSEFVRNHLDSDLVILGGPIRNQRARDFLRAIRDDYGLSDFVFDDTEGSLVVPLKDGSRFSTTNFRPELDDNGFPTSDLGLLIIARRWRSGKLHRSILCAGFTTYGTAAAAHYLFRELVNAGRRDVRRAMGLGLFEPFSDVLLVVEGTFNQGELIDVQLACPAVVLRLKSRTKKH